MLTALGILFLSASGLSKPMNGPVIHTPLGVAVGWQRNSRNGRTYNIWSKLPYAQPPVGRLRFRPPQSASKWEGVRDATIDMPYCMQTPATVWEENVFVRSEDCLYLNVYRPEDPANKPMPVLVYLYGGANNRGYIGRRWNADYLMDEDVVLIEPNFRVNSFGFLSLGDDLLPGNIGHKDQVMVLMWIKKYIHAFDGDASRVVVFGESSGAAAAHFILNSPLTKNILSGSVSHSGVINHSETLPLDDRTKVNSLKIVERVGCNRSTSEQILRCLQDLDASYLLNATMQESSHPVHLTFTTVLEPQGVRGAFLTKDPSLDPTNKPWIVTFTNGEFSVNDLSLRLTPQYPEKAMSNITTYIEDWLRERMKMTSNVTEKAAKVVKKYFSVTRSIAEFTVVLAKMHTDYNFIYGSLYDVKKHNGPKWIAQLEYKAHQVPRSWTPYSYAGHSSNTDFIFNRTGPYPWSSHQSYRDVVVSKRFIRYLVDFAYYSDPTPSGSPYTWQQFRTNEILRMTGSGDFLGDESFVEDIDKQFRFWSDIIGW